jgi:hypothetical protein
VNTRIPIDMLSTEHVRDLNRIHRRLKVWFNLEKGGTSDYCRWMLCRDLNGKPYRAIVYRDGRTKEQPVRDTFLGSIKATRRILEQYPSLTGEWTRTKHGYMLNLRSVTE